MGNCISEWRAKLRQERREATRALFNQMVAIPEKRAAERRARLLENRHDVVEKTKEIAEIVRDKTLTDDQKRGELIAPTRLLLAFQKIAGVNERNWGKSLDLVTLVQMLQARNEDNEDLVDMQELAKQVPGLHVDDLQDAIDKGEAWTADMRDVVETAMVVDANEKTPSLSAAEPTDSELEQAINKFMGAPSAQYSVQKPPTAAVAVKPVSVSVRGKSLVSPTFA
jgi:poly-D-alanine transfer protein DltD